jgi:ubiquinol-cytochrome c reductase iron-sulfur subunit
LVGDAAEPVASHRRCRSEGVGLSNDCQTRHGSLGQAPVERGDPAYLLSDPDSDTNQQPPYARNWHRSVNPECLVLVGVCTHLGCIPNFELARGGFLGPGWLGGYFCPCHGSKYDLAGRVFAGVPAPYNLPVPPYHFTGKQSMRIGENPPNTAWDFSSIAQI